MASLTSVSQSIWFQYSRRMMPMRATNVVVSRFLVSGKLVHNTLEGIIQSPVFPYAELKNTGIERSERSAKHLEWFKDEGHVIPEPSNFGVGLCNPNYLEELTNKDYRTGPLLNGVNVSSKLKAIDERFPEDENGDDEDLLGEEGEEEGNPADDPETNGDGGGDEDEDENGTEDDDDEDENGAEDDDEEEGDPEDAPEPNGDDGGDEDEDENDDEDDDEEEEIPKPPARKKK